MENNYEENADSKKVVAIGIIIIVIILVITGLIYSFKAKSSDSNRSSDPSNNEASREVFIPIVSVKHQYKNKVHTYVGELNLPSPCHILRHSVKISAENSPIYNLNFVASQTGELCAQVITPRPFKVSFEGPSEIKIMPTLNGEPLTFNLFEVMDNENLDEFEIFNKG